MDYELSTMDYLSLYQDLFAVNDVQTALRLGKTLTGSVIDSLVILNFEF